MQAGGFYQLYTEQSFSGKDGLQSLKISLKDKKGMILNGKIDRVDICETDGKDLLKIMDYKSGAMDLDLCRVYYGLQLQLFTYMAAAMELHKKQVPDSRPVPAALLYYHMEEPEIAWKEETEEGRQKRMLSALKCKGYVLSDADVLENLDSALMGEGGRSDLYPVKFKKDGAFDSHSHILSEEQLERLMWHVRERITEFGDRIYEGETGASPYQIQTENGCGYCRFSEVCGVEEKEIRFCARELEKMTEEEVWEALDGRNQVDRRAEEDH